MLREQEQPEDGQEPPDLGADLGEDYNDDDGLEPGLRTTIVVHTPWTGGAYVRDLSYHVHALLAVREHNERAEILSPLTTIGLSGLDPSDHGAFSLQCVEAPGTQHYFFASPREVSAEGVDRFAQDLRIATHREYPRVIETCLASYAPELHERWRRGLAPSVAAGFDFMLALALKELRGQHRAAAHARHVRSADGSH